MLFKTAQEIKQFAELTAGVSFANLTATLQHVEEVHIESLLGIELYTTLNTKYNGTDSLSSDETALLTACRKVIGPYLAYYYAAKGEVKLDDAGLRRLETANAKTAFQYQVTNFRKAQLQEAEQQAERLLAFLDSKRETFTQWVNGSGFQQYTQLFIKSGKEFNEYFPSHHPYRNYWAMRNKLHDAELLIIRPAITPAVFDALKTADQNNNLSDKQKTLLQYLKRSIAYNAVAASIPYLTVRIDANGITVTDVGTGTTHDDLSKRKGAPDPQLSLLITQTQQSADAWLNQAMQYLTENAADLGYTIPKPPHPSKTDLNTLNQELKGSFYL